MQGGDGELMLGLRGHSARVAEDAHHLVGRKELESGSAKRYGNHFIIGSKSVSRFIVGHCMSRKVQDLILDRG